ncbi:TPA: hypothetical protein ACGOVK_000149 [Streptococcus suis]
MKREFLAGLGLSGREKGSARKIEDESINEKANACKNGHRSDNI